MYNSEILLEIVQLCVSVSKDIKDGCLNTHPNYWESVTEVIDNLGLTNEDKDEVITMLKHLK